VIEVFEARNPYFISFFRHYSDYVSVNQSPKEERRREAFADGTV
jgi:hypothetical protein